MLKNYFLSAMRNLIRQKGIATINILGLAIGMATCMLIFLYLSYELSYDKFLDDHEDIYRLQVRGRISDDFLNVAMCMPALAPKLKADMPEVRYVARVQKMGTQFFSYDDKKLFEEAVYFVDSSFLDIFSYKLLEGDRSTVLNEPNTMVVTKSFARKYFGEEDAMGKMLKLNDQVTLKITGVLADLPVNTHMQFDALVSLLTTINQRGPESYDDNWGSIFLYGYVLLNDNTSKEEFDDKIGTLVKEAFGEESEGYNIELIPYLERIDRIHLHSNLMGEIEPTSDMAYIYTFSAIAIFILVIACINFMNLSTAQSVKRAREVGMRKVAGATRRQLIIQFMAESVLMSFIACVIAVVITEISVPFFNNLTGLDLDLVNYRGLVILILVILTLMVGIAAGSYPSLVLSSFKPIDAVKGGVSSGKRRPMLRNVLVIVQFTISIILLISTILIYKQLDFLREKDLGFDTENVIIIPLRRQRVDKADYFKSEFEKIPLVEKVSVSNGLPGGNMRGIGYVPEGIDSKSPWIIYIMSVDGNFLDAMGMKLIAGRNFSKEYGTDTSAVLINETLRKKLGWTDPVNKKIFSFGQEQTEEYHVIGVVGDYNFKSLHEKVEPSMIFLERSDPNFIILKISEGRIREGIDALRTHWEEMESSFPFDYFLLGDRAMESYTSDIKMGKIFIYFTILAILIACLGLFGLATYSAQQRTKEIGIRKVLGASVAGLVTKLGWEFTRWVILANLIAWPLAYILVDRWMQSFAYRIDILGNIWIFFGAAFIALFIALGTVSYRAVQAANFDPVQALKYE